MLPFATSAAYRIVNSYMLRCACPAFMKYGTQSSHDDLMFFGIFLFHIDVYTRLSSYRHIHTLYSPHFDIHTIVLFLRRQKVAHCKYPILHAF